MLYAQIGLLDEARADVLYAMRLAYDGRNLLIGTTLGCFGASSPVMFYAGLFRCVDLAYNVFEYQALAHAAATVAYRLQLFGHVFATQAASFISRS